MLLTVALISFPDVCRLGLFNWQHGFRRSPPEAGKRQQSSRACQGVLQNNEDDNAGIAVGVLHQDARVMLWDNDDK